MKAFSLPLSFVRRPKSLAGKAFAGLLVCVILLVVVWFVALFITERRLAAAMKRAEVEFGLPNNIEELLGPSVPPEKNAGVPLDEAAAIVQTLRKKYRGAAALNRTVAKHLVENPSLGSDSPEKSLDALLNEVDQRPDYSSTLIRLGPWFSNPYPLIEREDMLNVEMNIGEQIAKAGHADEAVRRLVRALRISRRWTNAEPHVNHFVQEAVARLEVIRVLNRILRTARIDQATYGAVDVEIIEQAHCQSGYLRAIQFDKLKRLEDYSSVPARQKAWWLLGPLVNNDRLLIVEWYNLLMLSAPRPHREVTQMLSNALEELHRIEKDPVGRWLHPDPLNVTSSNHAICDSLSTLSRCLRIVNAMAKQQKWDSDLDSLGLPEEALTDPINGKRLHVKETATGPIVYSVGFDGEDNGGVLEGKTLMGMDIGLGSPKAKDVAK